MDLVLKHICNLNQELPIIILKRCFSHYYVKLNWVYLCSITVSKGVGI